MRIPIIILILAAASAIADALIPTGGTLPYAVHYAELATLATLATIAAGLSAAASPFLTPDQQKSAGGQAQAGQLPAFQGQVPQLSQSQGTGPQMQAYLSQLAQQRSGQPSMRGRPRPGIGTAQIGAGAPGAAPAGAPGGGAAGGGQAGTPGMADLAGMLQTLYKQIGGFGG